MGSAMECLEYLTVAEPHFFMFQSALVNGFQLCINGNNSNFKHNSFICVIFSLPCNGIDPYYFFFT